MRALSLTQPWASLMFAPKPFRKVNETRDWPLPRIGYGDIAIHATREIDIEACLDPFFRASLKASGFTHTRELPLSSIIGVLCFTQCFPTGNVLFIPDISEQELAFGNYGPNRYAFRSERPRLLASPIPIRGHQKLWTVPPEIATQIERGA